MKIAIIFCCCVVLVGGAVTIRSDAQAPAASDGRKPRDVVILAPESKLGTVTFSHLNHTTKNRNLAGTAPMACIECHHTDQPKENLKAPLVTSERSVVLTADVLKDAAAGPVKMCRGCHLQAGDDSKPLPAITKDGKQVKLDNEVAYHTNCFACHDAAIKARPDVATKTSGSDPKGCVKCHVAK